MEYVIIILKQNMNMLVKIFYYHSMASVSHNPALIRNGTCDNHLMAVIVVIILNILEMDNLMVIITVLQW